MRKIWNNQYEQLRKIGEGASGRVMLARDLHLNRLVAIKEMEQIREIRREMELLKALKHPGLPDIYDYFEEDRHGFLVMEYVEGVTLKEYLEQHGKPETEPAKFRIAHLNGNLLTQQRVRKLHRPWVAGIGRKGPGQQGQFFHLRLKSEGRSKSTAHIIHIR